MLLVFKHGANVNNISAFPKKICAKFPFVLGFYS